MNSDDFITIVGAMLLTHSIGEYRRSKQSDDSGASASINFNAILGGGAIFLAGLFGFWESTFGHYSLLDLFIGLLGL